MEDKKFVILHDEQGRSYMKVIREEPKVIEEPKKSTPIKKKSKK